MLTHHIPAILCCLQQQVVDDNIVNAQLAARILGLLGAKGEKKDMLGPAHRSVPSLCLFGPLSLLYPHDELQ